MLSAPPTPIDVSSVSPGARRNEVSHVAGFDFTLSDIDNQYSPLISPEAVYMLSKGLVALRPSLATGMPIRDAWVTTYTQELKRCSAPVPCFLV